MKRASCVLIMMLSAIVARAQIEAKVAVVEITELTQEKSFEIMTLEAFQSLQEEMAARNQLLPKVLELTIKAWNIEHADAGAFPRLAASKGEVKMLGTFSDKAKAEEELKNQQSREEQQRKVRLSSLEKQLEQLKERLENLRGLKSPTTQQQTQMRNMAASVKVLEEQLARKKAREGEKDANLVAARDLFRSKLGEVLMEAGRPVPKKPEGKEP